MKNENRQHSLWFSKMRDMTGRHGLARKLAAGVAIAGLSIGAAMPAAAAPIQTVVDADSIIGLSEGSSGAEVKLVQQALISRGVAVSGGADGRFGPATASAVTSFQVRERLPTSGRIDEFTAAALGLVASGATAPTTPATATNGLQVGVRGDAVKTIQQQLLSIGVPVAGGADGIFGSGTKTAVSNFQRWNGLTVTGVVDSTTASRISSAAKTKATPPASAPAAAATPSTSTASTSSKFAGLQVGSRGTAVKELQQRLQATGLVIRGGADGIFGAATKAAVQAFQQVNGLERSGVVTAKVAQLIEGTTASTSSATPVAVKTPTSPFAGLKIGNSGDKVKQLQQALQNAGVTVVGGADGSFGNATKRALVAFQRVNGLSQTGVLSDAGAKVLGLGTSTATPAATTTSGSTSKGYAEPGEKSTRTRDLQMQLIAWGVGVTGGADSEFGASTVDAVKRFQKIHGLTVTGTVTSETAKKLQLPPVDKITPVEASSIKLDHFPMQGRCWYGDTWHAPRGGGRLHVGVDLIGAEGLYLYAVVDGTITKRFHDVPGGLSGNGLRLTAPDGTYFTYLHLLDVAPGIKIGTKVKAGDIIGFNGNTGNSATAHLHFEIHPGGGAAVNPYPYVRAIDACKDTSERFQTSYLPAG